MKFCATKPCAQCPFRSDIPGYLRRESAQEIADGLLSDRSFYCRKTCDYSDDDGDGRPTSKTLECAGAVIVMERMGQVNQMTRIMERLGVYDRNAMDMSSPVFHSLDEFVEHHDA